MTNFVRTAARDEKGFTLVELAVVMIIVGLLIGGILKGQEMISNAQLTSTVAQSKAFDAAVSTFRDQYQALPGDIAAGRLANCGAVCAQAITPGDNVIGGQPGAAQANLTNENGAAWAQLAAADLITGVDQSSAIAAVPTPGVSIPQASITGASWQIGTLPVATALTAQIAATNPRAGHYILLDNSGVAVASAATAALTPAQAARVDSKIDDGSPNTGSVVGMGAAGAAACASTNAANGVYNEALTDTICGLYVRVQG
jgi:prepilin-type N-terminal cleavage/methylation domain-containing protein